MKKKVIIVGTGIAGIAAAIELAENGCEVEMLETRNFPGGRFYSFIHKSTSEKIDNGQHIFVGAYRHFFRILNTLGTDHLIKKQKKLKVVFYDDKGKRSVLKTSFLPGRLGMAAGLLLLRGISLKSKINGIKFIRKVIYDKLVFNSDDSALNLLIRYMQNQDMIDKFWRPMVVAAMNTAIEEAPAVLFIEILKRAFFSGNDDASIYLPSVGLSDLIVPFEKWLNDRGGRIFFNKYAGKIDFDESIIQNITTRDGKRFSGDAYILAIQPNAAFKLLDKLFAARNGISGCKTIKFSTIISIYCWFDKDFIEEDFVCLVNSRLHWVFNMRSMKSKTRFLQNDHRSEKLKVKSEKLKVVNDKEKKTRFLQNANNGNSGFSDGHLALTISAADDLSELSSDEIIKIALEELHKIFPKSCDARLLDYLVIKDNRATLKITPEVEKFRPDINTEYKNLFLAGDWVNTGLPATLESAAQSGYQAAQLIMNSE